MTIADMLAVGLLTVAGFVATNLDNLLILVGLAAASTDRRAVVRGYLAAATTVLAACVASGAVGGLLHPGLVGYLGAVPLCLGLVLGWKVLRGEVAARLPGAGGAFFLTLSNSGDSIALFLPLLAETSHGGRGLVVLLYFLLVLAWAALALWLLRHRALTRGLASAGRWLLPAVMIVVGVYILLDTGTDTLR